ncbi:hypothetical protein ANN_05074 [Periplaneta americana]|uniref:Uncharacterized protein n=1 Tax=Periplaneta americana TaxID=6978 RepID=A0ABQ8TBD1_PERAM|nr:hypothetical protein ANN_05074 [Periplaneta americana]
MDRQNKKWSCVGKRWNDAETDQEEKKRLILLQETIRGGIGGGGGGDSPSYKPSEPRFDSRQENGDSSSSHAVRRLRWTEHVARMGDSRNAYRVLVGRLERKIPLGRPRHRWEDNIKMDLREMEYDDRDWINLAQDRDRWQAYVRAAMKLRNLMPKISGHELHDGSDDDDDDDDNDYNKEDYEDNDDNDYGYDEQWRRL